MKKPDFLQDDQWSIEPQQRDIYSHDWTTAFPRNASAVAFPRTTEDVQKIVLWAIAHKISLVPSGGRTGLSGGANATQGEVVVSFDKMRAILSLNEDDRCLHVQAGVITEEAQNFLAERGYFYPVDFAARGTSQLGGNVATNAGGIKVLKYGLTRDWIRGLTVVTGSGQVLHLNKSLIKNATGYDLRHLFIGSEGTLGFITEIELGYTTPPEDQTVILLAVSDLDSIMKVFKRFAQLPSLSAFEFFSDQALKIVLATGHAQYPLSERAAYYLVIEVESTLTENIMEIIESTLAAGEAVDGSASQSSQQAKDFWKLREIISESVSPFQPYKNDVSVKVSKVPEFLKRLDIEIATSYPRFTTVWFGHIGDGNIHVNILKPQDMEKAEFITKCKQVDLSLFQILADLDGSISAEHGVGLVKRDYLYFSRSRNEIALMKQIKQIFDPYGILNSGKLIPPIESLN